MTRTLRLLGTYWRVCLGIAALFGLYLTSIPDYLLFHTLAELVAIAVAICTFIIAWNGHRLYSNSYLFVVGTGFGFVAILELLHALAYKGMGVFPPGANLPTQLWIASRGLLAVSLVAAPLLLGRKLRADLVVFVYAVATALLVCSIFVWHIFPTSYADHPGGGLTAFKIVAEYVICLTMVVGLVLLWLRRSHFDPTVLRYLSGAVLLTIASELAFTSYVSVYGRANLTGHLLMVVSFYCFYLAIVRTAFVEPFRLLFRDLKQQENDLRAARETQEQMTQFLVHDIRSPLTTVMTAVSALRSAKESPVGDGMRRHLLDAAEASLAWLLTLTGALLDASRLENGALPITPRPVAADDLISSAVEHVSLWAELGDMNLQVQSPVVGARVVGDYDLTVRVLVNLLSNAIKHSPPGSTITVRAESDGAGAVAFSVADQGEGIPAEWVDRLFERFAVAPRAAGVAASGLGLHFCKLAVEAQGGRIWIASEEGKGTLVTFTLPAAPPPTEANV